jgi:two-component system, probable response regulator PhcQ
MTSARILLVDDEPHVLHALHRLLRQGLGDPWRDAEIVCHANPFKALAATQESAVDLVICDYRMPGLDGVQLLSRMARTHPDAVRVLLTGSPDLQAVIEAVNAAAVARVVLKPWDNRELLEIVQLALRGRQVRLEQLRLADEARLARGALDAQSLARHQLELRWPGITEVEWTADGAVQLGDTGLMPLDPQPSHGRN